MKTVALRVLRRGAKANRLETDEVHVPVEDTLARTMIKLVQRAVRAYNILATPIYYSDASRGPAQRPAYVRSHRNDEQGYKGVWCLS